MPSAQSGGPSPLWTGRWLVVLGIVAALPLAALAGYAAWQDQQLERQRAHDQVNALCLVTAKSAEDFAHLTQDMLASLARTLAAAGQDPAMVRFELANHLAVYSECITITAARADGVVYADPQAPPEAPPGSIAGEEYFQEAMQSGRNSIRTITEDGPDGVRTRLVFCRPILDDAGRPTGTVQAYCDPSAVPGLAAPIPLPEDASLVLIDSDGTVIVHSGEPGRWIGQRVPTEQAAMLNGEEEESVREGTFLGQAAVVGSVPVAGTPWRAAVAQPAARALAGWQSTLWGLGGAFAVALGLALFLGIRTAQVGQQGWQRDAFLRSLIESAPVGVAVVSGPENRIELVNPLYHRITSRPPEVVAGRPLREVLPAPVAEVTERHISEAYRANRVVRVREIVVETGDPPRTNYYDLDFMPLRHDRRPRSILTLAVPVTERVRTRQRIEALAREAEERAAQLQAVLASITDAVLVFGADSHIRFANAVALSLVGGESTPEALQRLEAIIQTAEMYWADGRPILGEERHLTRVLHGEPILSEEVMYRLQPGAPLRWERVSAAPVRDPGGHITGAVVTAADITAQKEAQAERERLLAEIQAAHANLRTIIDRLPDGVIVVDAMQRVVLCNTATIGYVGHDPTGLLLPELRREHGFVMPDGRPFPPGQAPVERALRGEAVAGVEVRLLQLGGQVFDALESTAPLYDRGRITGAVVALTDITEVRRVQAESQRLLAEAQAAHDNLRTLIDRLPAGVLVIDTAGRITLANSVVQQYLGPNLVGRTEAEVSPGVRFVTPDGRPIPPEQMPLQAALRGESISGDEERALVPGGGSVDLLSSAVALRDGQGRITGAVLVSVDITAQKQALAERERLLAEVERARRELQTIVDQLPDTVVIADTSGRVTLSNRTARQLAGRAIEGLSVAELHRLYDYRRPDGQRFVEEETPLARALRGEVITSAEARIKPPVGRRYDVLQSAAPVLGPQGEVREAVIVLSDVTALKELDRAKDEFISFAAHELRTPLTALKGHTQILVRRAERAGWAESDQRSLRTVDSQVDRLNDLIDRLLNVSRIRLGRLQLNRQPTDIVALARQVAEELQVTTDKHRINVQSEVAELVGHWDPSALRQVVTNLIGNAIRYADPGAIDVGIRRQAGQALLSVTDYGPGIPPERQARIFEAFRPGIAEEARRAGGLGLGLYISRGIVVAHGGRIDLQSEVGVGTTFTVSLPLDEG